MKEVIRKTKIVGTIGPASESEEMLTKLMNAGLNVTRINFSHGGYEENGEKIETIKKDGTVSNAVSYELDDDFTPVTLVATNGLFGDELGQQEYSIN